MGYGGMAVTSFAAGLVVAAFATSGQHTTLPHEPIGKEETERRVIAAAKTNNNRCIVPGAVNGVPLTLEIDTGDPVPIEFPSS
jgi:hypothetical protein